MRFSRIGVLFGLSLMLVVACASKPPISSSPRVLVDNIHGTAWPSIFADLQQAGFQTEILDTPLQSDLLDQTNVLILSDINLPFRRSEIQKIHSFVAEGGLLVCADQAWSWVSPKYGNQPIENFPLNAVSQRLGFWFTGQPAGQPNVQQGIFHGANQYQQAHWVPSKIQLLDAKQQTQDVIRDQNHNIIAVRLPYGKGQILVFGHQGFLEHNPQLFVYAIKQTLTYLPLTH